MTANEFGGFPAFASCPSAGEDIMKIIYFDRHDIYADIFSVMEATALDFINEISGYEYQIRIGRIRTSRLTEIDHRRALRH